MSLPRLGDISALTASIQKNWNPDGSFPAKADAVRTGITPNGISGFFDLVMKDFVLAIKDIVVFLLQGVKEIIGVMLDVLEDAVKSLQSVLNASIDIPVISYIYKLLMHDDLSILDLLCLILAVPVTILYKVIFGSAPFSDDSVNQLNNLTWPWLAAGAPSPDAKSVSLRSPVPPQLFVTMGVTAGFCNLVDAYIATACDSLAFADNPPKPLVQFLSWTNIALGVLRQFFGAPWKVFIEGSWSTAQKWSVANWAGNIVPLAANTIFTSFTGSQSEFKPFVGPILNAGFGLGLSGLGLGTLRALAVSGEKNKGWAMANSIVPRPMRFFKLCILLGQEDPETAPVFGAILVVADAVFGYGGTVTQIGAAVAG